MRDHLKEQGREDNMSMPSGQKKAISTSLHKFNSFVSGGFVLILALLLLGGCVSKSNFDDMVAKRNNALENYARIAVERDALAAQRDQLATEKDQLAVEKDQLAVEKAALLQQKADLSKQIQEIAAQKAQAEKEAQIARAEIARQQAIYDSLQQVFAKEQQQSQVKIEMLKSGIKVNLSNDILFPSGSALLNETGVDVLKRAAEELKKSPYQTLIAGYTDNVPISGKLMDRYPSNWELAGARAASVVRLLESEGVPSPQMLAISFGENSPVASNETPEGRKLNRRIELILRPVAIEMR